MLTNPKYEEGTYRTKGTLLREIETAIGIVVNSVWPAALVGSVTFPISFDCLSILHVFLVYIFKLLL